MPAWLDLIVKTSGLLLAAAAIVGLMRRSSAASKHLVWTAMFAATLVVPIARFGFPALPVPVLRPTAPLPSAPSWDAVETVRAGAVTEAETNPSTVNTLSVEAFDRRPAGPAGIPKWTSVQSLFTIWFAGTAFFLLRIVIGTIGARQLLGRASRVTDSRLLARLDECRRVLNVRRSITLFVSKDRWMPATWGLLRPTIMAPSAVIDRTEECPEQFNAVLIHEVAHVARLDAVSRVIAQFAVAVWWFNPLFWIAARQARLERERACDDAVLAHGSRASDYAGHLLAFVRTLAPAPMSTTGTLAMAHLSQLEQRVMSILDATRNRSRVSRASRLLAAALIMGMLPVSAVQLVGQTPPVGTSRDDTPGAVTAASGPPPMSDIATRSSVATEQHPSRIDKPTPMLEQAPTAPQQANQNQSTVDDAKWREECAEMFGRLKERARAHLRNSLRRVEIGTLAPIDTVNLDQLLTDIERAESTTAFLDRSVRTSEADRVAVRQRVAAAMRNLDAAEVRFDNGLVTTKDVAAAVKAVLDALRVSPTTTQAAGGAPLPTFVIGPDDVLVVTVWREPEVSGEVRVRPDGGIKLPVGNDIVAAGLTIDQLRDKVTIELGRFYQDPTVLIRVKEINSRRTYVTGTTNKPALLSDTDLIAALRNASAIASDTARADTLLALAGRYPLSPEMVTLYVSAANGIASDSERARVFAQPIRLKGGR